MWSAESARDLGKNAIWHHKRSQKHAISGVWDLSELRMRRRTSARARIRRTCSSFHPLLGSFMCLLYRLFALVYGTLFSKALLAVCAASCTSRGFSPLIGCQECAWLGPRHAKQETTGTTARDHKNKDNYTPGNTPSTLHRFRLQPRLCISQHENSAVLCALLVGTASIARPMSGLGFLKGWIPQSFTKAPTNSCAFQEHACYRRLMSNLWRKCATGAR